MKNCMNVAAGVFGVMVPVALLVRRDASAETWAKAEAFLVRK